MNPLNEFPALRRIAYFIQWAVTGVQTVLSALFAFTDGSPDNWPRWFLGTLAVTPVLWSYLGITAQANVTDPAAVTHYPDPLLEDYEYEPDDVDQGLIFGDHTNDHANDDE